MEDLLHKYWYVGLGALLLLYFVSKRGGSNPPMLQQIGGSDATTLALAQLNSDNQNKQLDRQFGFASTLLNYNLQSRQVDQIIPLAQIQDAAAARALQSQQLLAQLQMSLQSSALTQQLQLQQYAISKQASAQNRQDWLSLITTGLGAFFGL